ncbi:YtoQ family protein [Sulfuriroseicoccus oceanibius]
MHWNVYLAGEIHTDWRSELKQAAADLPITFLEPVTDHASSDDCGARILGGESDPFWHDRKGAGVNAIRTRPMIERADAVVVKFGDKYRQWNAAFDAGMAAALGKPLIVVHPDEFRHALKEVDAAACAVASDVNQVAEVLRYVVCGELPR